MGIVNIGRWPVCAHQIGAREQERRLSYVRKPYLEQKNAALSIAGNWSRLRLLAACEDKAEVAPPPQQVRVVAASETQYQPGAEITGEVKARIQTELSFRISGRVIERWVDVGSHVRAGEILARLNDTEQQADVSVARAALESAQAIVNQKMLAFDRARLARADRRQSRSRLSMKPARS